MPKSDGLKGLNGESLRRFGTFPDLNTIGTPLNGSQ